MWEENYEAYLRDIRVVGMRSDPEHDLPDGIGIFPNRIVARFDNEIGKLKQLAEKIIFILIINVVVMISILLVLIVIMCK